MKISLCFLTLLVTSSLSQRHNERHSGRNSNSRRSGNGQCVASAIPPDRNCCGIDGNIFDNIIGGTKTGLRQYPWLALIEYQSVEEPTAPLDTSCGGTLISGKYVLTAAHCLAGPILKDATPVSVRFGEYYLGNDLREPDCVFAQGRKKDCVRAAFRIPIDYTIAHSGFLPKNNKDDIGLVRLKEMVRFTTNVRPICLPQRDLNVNLQEPITLHAAGWGVMYQRHFRNRERQDYDSNVKRHVALPIKAMEDCKATWGKKVGPTKICAGGDGGKGTCLGDSGGPLMYENGGIFEIVGITSFGPGSGCASTNIPDVFTNVYAYKQWLIDNIVPDNPQRRHRNDRTHSLEDRSNNRHDRDQTFRSDRFHRSAERYESPRSGRTHRKSNRSYQSPKSYQSITNQWYN